MATLWLYLNICTSAGQCTVSNSRSWLGTGAVEVKNLHGSRMNLSIFLISQVIWNSLSVGEISSSFVL